MKSRLLTLFLLFVSTGLLAKEPTPLEEDRFRFLPSLSKHGMVVAERMAAEAGVEVMRRGGNAVDAAVTAALTMAVTLPRAGNLGGGGFMLIRTPQGKVEALDFRELAPERASRDMYLDGKGQVDRDKATVGALCVGVPGTVAGLDEALKRYGTLTLQRAAHPAQVLAATGFPVPDWLSDECERIRTKLILFPESAAIFLPGGEPPVPGSQFIQQDLAWSLAQIEQRGRDGFYQGPLAERLAAAVQAHGGIMTTRDLAGYRAVWRQPVSGTYRGYSVYSMPPPSSGGVHLIEGLNVLEGYPLAEQGPNSAASLHEIIETLRQVFADRSKWLGDPSFFKVPTAWLTSKEYAAQIRAAIPEHRARASSQVNPGQPRASSYESPQTTQICAVDQAGWAVSLTYTLNYSYGSALVAKGTGILLNDEMDDFSAAPGQPNGFGLLGGEANAIAPGKRPLSSMTPTIVDKDGKLYAALGSPGGSHIITAVLQVLLNLVDFDENAQTAVSEPRIHHQWYPDQVDVEQGFSPDTLRILQEWGHKVVRANSLGHAMVILERPDGMLEGAADPRRTGASAVGY